MVMATMFAPQSFEDCIGRHHHKLAERLVFCHKDKLHQDIVIILIELLASKGDLHAAYGRQHGIFQHTAVNALHTAKQRAPGHVV
jgi:hypothetical protein